MTKEQQIVYDTAVSQGASDMFAKIATAQLMHESANFTSNVYKKNNNANGMKLPSKRKSPFIAGAGTRPPGNEGATPYARFNSLSDNVKDLFHWLNYNGIDHKAIEGVNDYAERLRKRSYMGNTQTGKLIYIAGLNNNLKRAFGSTIGGAGSPTSSNKSAGLNLLTILVIIAGFAFIATRVKI